MARTAAARPPFGNAAKPHRMLAGGARFLSTPGWNGGYPRCRDSGTASAAKPHRGKESGAVRLSPPAHRPIVLLRATPCVTTNGCPAIVRVALRALAVVFAAVV